MSVSNLVTEGVVDDPIKGLLKSLVDGQNKGSLKGLEEKKGIILIKSTKINVFCTLMDIDEKI